MYAVVKTGGKQYRVSPGDVIEIEKLPAEIGDIVELPVIFIADGDSIEADPAKAASTKVTAQILDQFKGKKQLVFKFKKRKNYKRLRGHRQQLTRVRIMSVGLEKYKKKSAKVVEEAKAEVAKIEDKAAEIAEAVEEKIEDAVEAVEEKAAEAAEAVKDAAETVKDTVEEAAAEQKAVFESEGDEE